ncbi:MAG: hypothetical protein Q7V31_02420 [Parvibaculum sp.]|uniref:hypothetical protein n=1 Tax=Parvibaculum sp. TaxID=2024848 RepID=UPI002727C118|nr:hypothetical protein [Parvibaculum sp.]MDO8837755.1 hypothetical protein [Parvibaculum sp.]
MLSIWTRFVLFACSLLLAACGENTVELGSDWASVCPGTEQPSLEKISAFAGAHNLIPFSSEEIAEIGAKFVEASLTRKNDESAGDPGSLERAETDYADLHGWWLDRDKTVSISFNRTRVKFGNSPWFSACVIKGMVTKESAVYLIAHFKSGFVQGSSNAMRRYVYLSGMDDRHTTSGRLLKFNKGQIYAGPENVYEQLVSAHMGTGPAIDFSKDETDRLGGDYEAPEALSEEDVEKVGEALDDPVFLLYSVNGSGV